MSAKKQSDPKQNNKAQKTTAGKNDAKNVPLPPLLEMGFSLAGFLMVAVPLVVGLVSYLSNASLMDIILRMAVTVGGMGILLCIFLRLLNYGVLKSSQEQIVDALEEQRMAASHEVQA